MAAIGFNLIFIFQGTKVPAFVYLIFNGFIFSGYFIILFVVKKRKDRFEREFRKILEIVD